MCNLQKRLIRTERLKTNGTAIKITREATNNQQKKTYTETTIFIHKDTY